MSEGDLFRKILQIRHLTRIVNEYKSNGESLDTFSSEVLELKKLCSQFKYSITFLQRQSFNAISVKSTNIESSNLKIFDHLYHQNDAKPSSKRHELKGVLVLFSKKVLATETYRLYVMCDLKGSLMNILPYFPNELKIKFKEYAQRYPRKTIDILVDMWYPGLSKSDIFDLIRRGKKTNILQFNVFAAYDKDQMLEVIPSNIFTCFEAPSCVNESIHLYDSYPFFKIFFKTVQSKPVFNHQKLIYQVKPGNQAESMIDLPLGYLLHNKDCVVFNEDDSLHWLNVFQSKPSSDALELLQKKYITNQDRIIVSRDKVGNIKYLLPLFHGGEELTIDLSLRYDLEMLKTITITEETIEYIRNTSLKPLLEQMFGSETEKLLKNISVEWDGRMIVTSDFKIGNGRLDFLEYLFYLKFVSKKDEPNVVPSRVECDLSGLTIESFDSEVIHHETNDLKLITR